jgi:hypothetical protein
MKRILTLLLASATMAVAQTRPAATPAPAAAAPASTAFVPLFKTAEHKLVGPLASTEFFFQLPGHIELTWQPSLTLNFRASQLLIADISTATFELNGVPLKSIRLPGQTDGESQKVELSLPAGLLRSGFNRVNVRCLMITTDVHCRDVDNPACWLVLEKGTGLTIPYRRLKLFPELGRFPATMTEEQLLRQEELVEGFPLDSINPVTAVLLPAELGNESFRAFVIASARLGQPTYLPNQGLRVGVLADWQAQSSERNGVLIGLTSDLTALDLPAETRAAVSALQPGEGLISEFIIGETAGAQRRWIVVCGADQAGLVKASLALGSNDSLGAAATNPWVIRDTPQVLPLTEKIAQPPDRPQTFARLYGGELALRGVFRSQASFAWDLPPGYETAEMSELFLEMSHAAGFADASSLMFTMNNRLLPGVALDNVAQERKLVRLNIPAGIPGRAPNSLAITSYLDIGTTDCAHRNEERAWVAFSPASALAITSRPLIIKGLNRLGYVLLRDAFLRRASILLPKSSLPAGLEPVRDLSLYLGRYLSSMPVLWPDAALYSESEPVPPSLLESTSAVLLGRPSDWRLVLDAKTPLSVDPIPGEEALRLQGKVVPFNQIPSDAVFAEFINSPWSKDNCVVTIGAIDGIGGDLAVKLLTDQEVLSKLDGTVAGLDSKGRVFHYDVRSSDPRSLSEEILNSLPSGMSAEDTTKKLEDEKSTRTNNILRNIAIGAVGLAIVAFMVRTQVRLAKLKAENRRKSEKKSKDV